MAEKIVEKLTAALVDIKGDKDRVKKITEKYLLLMALCVADTKMRHDFETNPKAVLKEYIPEMKISEDAIINLDTYDNRWASVTFSDPNMEIVTNEHALTVTNNICTKEGQIMDQKVESRETSGSIAVEIPMAKSCKKVINLPYFTYKTDILTEYKFQGQTELIMSTCC